MPQLNIARAALSAALAVGIVAAVVCLGVRAEDAPKPETPAFTLTFDEEGQPEAAIRAVLARRVAVDVREMPLREFLAAVRRDCGISTFVNEEAVTDEGVALDTPVTLKLSGVSLKSALRWVLGPLQLRMVVREGVVHFTTAAEAVNLRTTRVYDVSDLIANEKNPEPVLEDLVEAIKASTGGEPDGPWPDFDGEGHGIRPRKLGAATVLVIEQTDAVHEQLGQMFRDIRAALNLPTGDRQRAHDSGDLRSTGVARSGDRPQRGDVIRFLPDDAPDSTARILEALERRVAVDFEDVPLTRVAGALSRMCAIPVFLNEQALIDEGVKPETPVTLSASGVTLREALNLSLHPLQLRALVVDEVLLITTAAEAVNERTCRVYNVTDLVHQDQTDSKGLLFVERIVEDNTGGEPDGPWQDVDGEGGDIKHISFSHAQLLVFHQTESVYRQIDQLLRDLRAARARNVIPIAP